MNKYLLEIGVEEFPAGDVKSMHSQLNKYFREALEENDLAYREIRVESTPRRFSILLTGLEQKDLNTVEEVKGPSVKIAYGEDKEPTKALLGFLKGQNSSLEDLTVKEFKGEDYVFIEKEVSSLSIEEILQKEIPEIIRKLNSSKTMKWGGKNLRFARPIRYFLSLYNDEILEFDLENIIVSNKSKGHRDLGSSEIIIDKIDNYRDLLRENGVILRREDRRRYIKSESVRLAKENGGELYYTEELLNELIDINEFPTPFIGDFDPRYLVLPQEVIITVMVEHQRYFAVKDDEGNLLANFIAVRNGNRVGIDNVREGNEKVIEPRLRDAEFFYKQDLEKDLEEYVPRLKTAVYHEDLGSLYDKTNRLVKLTELIGNQLVCAEEAVKNTQRAAYLSKADLMTSLVTEFTELQGIMGEIYARESGEKKSVAKAIREQYMPTHSDGELPESTAGMILSIADKIDSISSMYAVGVRVTGSQDPYALRRAALGIINMILDKNLHLDLEDLVKDALFTVLEDQSLVFDYETVKGEILEFFKARYRSILIDEGYSYDLVDSVLNTSDTNIYQLNEKIIATKEFLSNNDELLQTVNRVENIIKDHEDSNVSQSLLVEDEEKTLYKSISKLDEIDSLIERGDYKDALESYNDLTSSLNKFFDNVMVMVDDEEIKNNRLSLLRRYYNTIKEIFIPAEIVKD